MDLAESVLSEIRRLSKTPADQIGLESKLRELGLDSLDLAEMGTELEDSLGVMLNDSQTKAIFSAVTVADIVRAISGAG